MNSDEDKIIVKAYGFVERVHAGQPARTITQFVGHQCDEHLVSWIQSWRDLAIA